MAECVRLGKEKPAQRSMFLRSADIFVRNRARAGVGSGQEYARSYESPFVRYCGARTFLSATVRAPAWEADKNVRAPMRVHS